jgi:hypothetical protein
LRDFKGREHLFLLGILPLHNMNVDLSMSRLEQEKTESKKAQGLGGQEVWPAGNTLPSKILGFSPKFPYNLLTSLLPLILEIWKEIF